MKKLLIVSFLALFAGFKSDSKKSLHDFKARTLDGKEFDFSSLKGKKVLIVNTASECEYTPQYEGLEQLYQKYKAKNFEVVGFPCNDFGGQEPGTSEDIMSFCAKNYGVSFLMMEKVQITGGSISPIYKWLMNKSENGVLDSKVNWNFNKYLIDENGKLVNYLPSKVKPMDPEITNWIEGK